MEAIEKIKNSNEIEKLNDKYRLVFEKSSTGILVIKEGYAQMLNSRAVEIFGYPESEIKARPLIEFIHDDCKETVINNYRSRVAGKECSSTYQFKQVTSDGEIRWIELSASLIEWDGQTATLNFIDDVTEKVLLQDELKKNEKQLRAQFDSAPMPIFKWQRVEDDFELIDYNEEAFRQTEGRIKSILGVKMSQFYKDDQAIRDDAATCFHSQKSYTRRMEYKYLDGSIKFLSVRYSYVPPDLILVYTDDITEQIKMEKSLKESESRYRTIFDEAPIGIAIFNSVGIVVTANKVFESMLSSSIEEINETDNKKYFQNPVDIDIIKVKMQNEGVVREYTLGLLDSKMVPFYVSVTITPLTINNEDAYLVNFVDTTGKTKAEEMLLKRKIYENMITAISTQFINVPYEMIDDEVKKALLTLGRYLKAKRMLVTTFSGDNKRLTNYYEWCHESEKTFNEEMKHVQFEGNSRIIEQLKNNNIIFISTDGQESEKDVFNKKFLKEYNIKLFCCIPLMQNEVLIGFIGLTYDHIIYEDPKEIIPLMEITGQIFVNILNRKEAEEELRIYQHIVSTTKDYLVFLDNDGIIHAVNEAFISAIDDKSREITGKNIFDFFNLDDDRFFLEKQFAKSIRGEVVQFEKQINLINKGICFMEIFYYPYLDKDGTVAGIVMNFHDISSRIEVEKQMLNISEHERQKIAMDLHDGVGHELLHILIKSRMLSRRLGEVNNEEEKNITEIESLVNKTMTTVRGIASGLFPYNEGHVDLMEMIIEISEKLKNNFQMQSSIILHKTVKIVDITKLRHIYYIINEAAINAIKHSEAKNIDIILNSNDDFIFLTVRDDGGGIKDYEYRTGLGLQLLQYRARILQGSIDIMRRDSGGTDVILKLPLEKISMD